MYHQIPSLHPHDIIAYVWGTEGVQGCNICAIPLSPLSMMLSRDHGSGRFLGGNAHINQLDAIEDR